MRQVWKCKTEALTSWSANIKQSRPPIAFLHQRDCSRLPACFLFPCLQHVGLHLSSPCCLCCFHRSFSSTQYPHPPASLPCTTLHHSAFAPFISYPSLLLQTSGTSIARTSLYDSIDNLSLDIPTWSGYLPHRHPLSLSASLRYEAPNEGTRPGFGNASQWLVHTPYEPKTCSSSDQRRKHPSCCDKQLS